MLDFCPLPGKKETSKRLLTLAGNEQMYCLRQTGFAKLLSQAAPHPMAPDLETASAKQKCFPQPDDAAMEESAPA